MAEAEGWNLGRVNKLAGVKNRIANITEYGAVELVGPRFGDYVYLGTRLRTVLRIVERRVNPVWRRVVDFWACS
jgi:hypothetical protein